MMKTHYTPAKGSTPVLVLEAADRARTDIGLLHVNAGLLVERYFQEGDPCVAIWVSRQFRLISENSAMLDGELKVLYRTLAARWHQMAISRLTESRPGHPWLDEFADGALM